jgi:epoxyqueuosine reductase
VSGAKDEIRAEAERLGFDAVGFAAAQGDADDADHLARYLAEGRHGDMAWMATTADRRADPQALWPAARSAIVVGLNYGPAEAPLAALAAAGTGAISVYARGRDYHDVMKKRLKALGRWLVGRFGGEAKAFVDTAPLMEKPLAQRAGLGWVGKHTNLVSRRFGSWLFLGEVLTTLDLTPDAPAADHCGSCDACRRACPTGALPAPYRIEPRRCLSYLTIEHRGDLPPDLANALGNRVYGCDDCLAACPWNRFATPTPHAELRARTDLERPSLALLAGLDDAGFRDLFAGTAIKRSGRDRMVRNALTATGNGDDPDMAAVALRSTGDASPLVRAAANRLLSRLGA